MFQIAVRFDSAQQRRKWEQIREGARHCLYTLLDKSRSSLELYTLSDLEARFGAANEPIVVPITHEHEDIRERIVLALTRPRATDPRGLPQRVIGQLIVSARPTDPKGMLVLLQDVVLLAMPESSLFAKHLALQYAPFPRNQVELRDLQTSIGLVVGESLKLVFALNASGGSTVLNEAEREGFRVSRPVCGYSSRMPADTTNVLTRFNFTAQVDERVRQALVEAGYAAPQIGADSQSIAETFSTGLTQQHAESNQGARNQLVVIYKLKRLYVFSKENEWKSVPDADAIVYLSPDGTFFMQFAVVATGKAFFSVTFPPSYGLPKSDDQRVFLSAFDLRPGQAALPAKISFIFQLQEEREQFLRACAGDFTVYGGIQDFAMNEPACDRGEMLEAESMIENDFIERELSTPTQMQMQSTRPTMFISPFWTSPEDLPSPIEQTADESVLFGPVPTSAGGYGKQEEDDEEEGLFGSRHVLAPVSAPSVPGFSFNMQPIKAGIEESVLFAPAAQQSHLFGDSDGEEDEFDSIAAPFPAQEIVFPSVAAMTAPTVFHDESSQRQVVESLVDMPDEDEDATGENKEPPTSRIEEDQAVTNDDTPPIPLAIGASLLTLEGSVDGMVAEAQQVQVAAEEAVDLADVRRNLKHVQKTEQFELSESTKAVVDRVQLRVSSK